MTRQTRGLVIFLALSFGATWGLAFGVGTRANYAAREWDVLVTALFAVPALAALFVREFVEGSGLRGVGLRWGRGRSYLCAWLLPPAFAAAAMGLAVLLKQAEFDVWMAELLMRTKLNYPDQPLDPDAARVGVLVVAFTVGMIPKIAAGFVTEFAWRGYLLMQLVPRLGTWRALVVTGAISGVWLAPFVLLPNRLTPYLYPEHPRLGVLLMVGFAALSGVLLGWLRLASGSLFPAAVGAASFNGPARTALFFLRSRNDLTTGLTGLIGQGVMLVFVLGLWRYGARRRGEGETDVRSSVPEQGEQREDLSVPGDGL